ncbi:hypothetical protein GGI43DRAFT_400046, partial [Trichoderma evansii]
MLLHHMMSDPDPKSYFVLRLILPEDDSEGLQYDSSQETDDGEEPVWGSQDTTVYGSETEYEHTDYDDETEPLLQEWLTEQRLLSNNSSQTDDDDDSLSSSFSTASTLSNLLIINWLDSDDSGYDSNSSDYGGHNSFTSMDSSFSSGSD